MYVLNFRLSKGEGSMGGIGLSKTHLKLMKMYMLRMIDLRQEVTHRLKLLNLGISLRFGGLHVRGLLPTNSFL